MKYRILSKDEKALFGANLVALIDNTDLAAMAAGNTGSVTVAPPSQANISYPAGATNPSIPVGTTIQFNIGTRLKLIAMRLVTPFVFSDGTLISSAVVLGDTGSANRYLTSTELNAAGAFVTFSAGTGTGFILTAGDNLFAAFTGTAAKNLNTATAGQVAFYIAAEDLTQLPTV